MEQIILVGCGGHAASVMDSIMQQGRYQIAGFIEREKPGGDGPGGIPIIGSDQDLKQVYDSGIRTAFVTVGCLGRGSVRERLYGSLKQIGYEIPAVIDPSAVLARGVHIGEGTYVGKCAVINTGAEIGRMCIINTGAVVEHGCSVGDFSHVAVGSVLCGGVKTGRDVLVGAGAVVIQGICIGTGAIVGAGVTVRHDVETGQTYYGK